MASPNTTVLDAATKELLYKIDDLIVPFEELAQAAQQCLDGRFEIHRRNEDRENERIEIESELKNIKEQAAHLKQRRQSIISRIPPHLLTHARSSADLAEADLDAILLGIEEVKLMNIPIMIQQLYEEITDIDIDMGSFQDPNVRTKIRAALRKFRDALSDFQLGFNHLRREAVDEGLKDLSTRRSEYGMSPVLSEPSELLDNEVDDDSLSSSAVMVACSSISSLNLGSPLIPANEGLDENRLSLSSSEDAMFRFERNHPPTLLCLAEWLGLDDPVSVALLLNNWPIQHAFQAYRATTGESCAENPKRLKLVLPLFTYSRETLQLWQAHANEQREENCLDISAALFANHVVRFLERSSEVVAWERVTGDITSLEDYETARYRWAVVLQIFWFMQKAFGFVE
ncbi:hypothetical protein FHL15_009672 [Xylaria flabelliformis]|uniref:Uncharacterized protein n=1 Tax=Xylaria flabelliformis TaxID=2512241 RepID=A0A553HN39_9PEZI|nr:hypothetical protein FHL15_009672 [Xylaria flabelliformis]